MAWPVDAQHTNFASGVTRIGNVFLGAAQSGLTGVVGGSMPITRLTVTGGPYLSGAPGGLAASGAIKAVGNIETVSGTVAGNRLQANNGGTSGVASLELLAGTTTYAYHQTTAAVLTSGGTSVVMPLSMQSGHSYHILARCAGYRADGSGSSYTVISAGRRHNGTAIASIGTDQTLASQADGSMNGMSIGSTSGTIQVTGLSGFITRWTIYADVTITA